MKSINIVFDDKDYAIIKDTKKKTGRTWHEFLLLLVRRYNQSVTQS